jgi:hypothetical protein
MTTPLDVGQHLDARDASGSVPAVVVSQSAYRDLLAERDALRQRVAELEKERDEYLAVLSRHGLGFTAQELGELREGGFSFEEVLRDVERVVGPNPGGD